MFVEEGFPFLVVLIRNLYRKWYRRYSRKTEKCPNQPQSPLHSGIRNYTKLACNNLKMIPNDTVYQPIRQGMVGLQVPLVFIYANKRQNVLTFKELTPPYLRFLRHKTTLHLPPIHKVATQIITRTAHSRGSK